MPDISMCDGRGCPFKGECYRHTAAADEYRQAYLATPPIKIRTGAKYDTEAERRYACSYYWPDEPA